MKLTMQEMVDYMQEQIDELRAQQLVLLRVVRDLQKERRRRPPGPDFQWREKMERAQAARHLGSALRSKVNS